MRYAIALLIAGVAGCGSGAVLEPLPVPPASDISVVTPTSTITGTAATTVIRSSSDCPAELGIGVRAATSGAAVTAFFLRSPVEGTVYDLSVPGTSDFVVVSATAGNHVYCASESGAAGTVEVRRFEAAPARDLIDVVLTGVVAGTTTIDAHLYH